MTCLMCIVLCVSNAFVCLVCCCMVCLCVCVISKVSVCV